uniref:NAC domain-containing protein n=1 Tax=Tanacetum cinerariifolium TaxID=118510 RepID=A0A699GL85_TANCI|nr:hypothetical protein [Tanacetum cinerariifolium]
MHSYKENNCILEEILRTLEANSPIDVKEPEGSNDYTEVTYDNEQCLSDHYTAHVTPSAYTLSIPFLATMKPADTLLMGDEVISTIPIRKTNEFIKSSVDDLVLIPKDSEVTSDSDSECDMPAREHLDTLSTGDKEIDFDPIRDIEELERLLADDLVLVPRVFDEPLGNDSKPRSYDVTFLNPLFDFNDDFTLCNDNPLFEEECEDISSLDPLVPTLVIDESSLLVTPLLDPKHICLREVERFDPFFSLTQSGEMTKVMETPSFGFHHMPSPRHAAYSPKEVMYCYYHHHLISGDGFDHEPKMK